MIKELLYPFDPNYVLENKRKIKKQLLEEGGSFVEKKIAILGGSTTAAIKQIMELFLLNNGIKAEFYESEYNKYYEDAVFDNEELKQFKPDIIYVCRVISGKYKFIPVSNSLIYRSMCLFFVSLKICKIFIK